MQECACQPKLTKGRMLSHSITPSLSHTLSPCSACLEQVIDFALYLAWGAELPWGRLNCTYYFRLI